MNTKTKNITPATDATIAQKYSSNDLEKKVQNKTALQQELGWPSESKQPVLCLPAGMSDELGGELLVEVLPGLLSLPIQILILGKGESKYGELFTKLAQENKHRLAIISNEEKKIHAMYAAADMALFLSDTQNSPDLEACLAYGVVPIAPDSKSLESYDPIQESGYAFTFEKQTVWDCYAAIVRALETHKFPFDWRSIQKNCMNCTK